MKKMLWEGCFRSGPSDETVDFNSAENTQLDELLIQYDILGSLAHIRMLYKQKIISAGEYEQIAKALKKIYTQWKTGNYKLKTELEDVHMNIESAVTSMTVAGKKMHTARSRNDQILLDMRLYMRDKIIDVILAIEAFQKTFELLSKKDGPMVAYTHTRVAQPITISFWCESWVESFKRDSERLTEIYKRVNQNPLGACAVAGTCWNIDRSETEKLLAFDTTQKNELDTISSRGECETELLSVLAIVMCKLSRLSEELIWLSEKSLVEIAEEHTTGSSIMPNKKNPDILELIRGRAGRTYGNLVHCLTTLKGLMAGYNSDMQETKFAVVNGVETTSACLNAMGAVVAGLRFDKDKIENELDGGFAQATEIADYLAIMGVPFREAHEKSGKLVKFCEQKGKTIGRLSDKEASGLLGIKITTDKWTELKGFERARLKRKVVLDTLNLNIEKKQIENAYSALLQQ